MTMRKVINKDTCLWLLNPMSYIFLKFRYKTHFRKQASSTSQSMTFNGTERYQNVWENIPESNIVSEVAIKSPSFGCQWTWSAQVRCGDRQISFIQFEHYGQPNTPRRGNEHPSMSGSYCGLHKHADIPITLLLEEEYKHIWKWRRSRIGWATNRKL